MNFIDLKAQYKAYQSEIDSEMKAVIESCAFIMGPQVAQVEQALANFVNIPHAITCASGTDALLLALLALDLQTGDEVIVPDFTFFATAEAVSLLGGTPIFADINPETWNIDVADIERKITPRTKGIIPVSLYGQCADLDAINALASAKNLWVIEDAAQSFGATYKGKRSGTLSTISTTSFFPAKPLGCFGDGGAVFTANATLAAKVRSLLNHGQEGRYRHTRIGINGRFDTLQAAVILAKLPHYQDEIEKRNQVAAWYSAGLAGIVRTPHIEAHNISVWAQYTVAHPKRETICEHLKTKGIPTAVHYPTPLHSQPVYAATGIDESICPVSAQVSRVVFSLPMHPFLSKADVNFICNEIRAALS